MESPKDKFKDFAISFFKIAKKDLERARNMFASGDFAGAVFFCQQCVEKIVKAVLETSKITYKIDEIFGFQNCS